MGRKPGIPNKPKPVNVISKSDAIMAIVHDLSDSEIRCALFLRAFERLNTAGKIEAYRYMIGLYQEPLKYVKSGVTMGDCECTINDLNRMITDLQKEQDRQKTSTEQGGQLDESH